MYAQSAVELRARRRRPLHRARQPAGKRNQPGFAGRSDQEQESNNGGVYARKRRVPMWPGLAS